MDAAALSRLFAPLEPASGIGLAVSGGPDSLALLLLARRWAERLSPRPRLVVLTVDHALRPESAAEAQFVAEIAASLGLESRILRREGPMPTSDVEAAAREARYRLLLDAAREMGLRHLATAHHQDDQAETLLLRLGRGSGVYGLGGMARVSCREDIRIVRPFLDVPRSELAAIVAEAGLQPIDDPHNRDDRFARSRLRQAMPELAAMGLTAPRLAATASRLRRAAVALDSYATRLLAGAAQVDAWGGVHLAAAPWRAEPEEVRLRVLARVLRAAGGADYVPRLDSLSALETAMRDGSLQPRTLAGVQVSMTREQFAFHRELGRDGLPVVSVAGGFDGVWDRRFHLRFEAFDMPVRIAALGAAGRLQLPEALRSGPIRAIEATPAVWAGERLVAAPVLVREERMIVEARPIVAERLKEAVEEEES